MTKKAEKITEIHGVVTRLFAQKGYHNTSMREIARDLGMNQSSLYHYFASKEEILYTLINDAMDEALNTLEEICKTDISPHGKLNRVLSFYTNYYTGDLDRLRLLVNEQGNLGEDYRRILIKKERRYVHLIQSILKALADEGRMKPIPPVVATFAFFGMVHYTIKWYHKNGSVKSGELADYFLEIFTNGIFLQPSEE
ncbi:MAG TPA: TetR/AcrR family transcriptional regulator [Desulfobacteria bacterium]|nr:TetR/AcrR family transcriptional regulator [Desulfobacteria bacterium]